MKNITLSIDWDYFFPDISEYDFGHTENPFFNQDIWNLRTHAVETLVPSGHLDFWKKLDDLKIKPNSLIVSDSHMYGYHAIKTINCDTVVVFDQHLDVVDKDKDKDFVTCENWILRVLEDNPDVNFIVVMPDKIIHRWYGKSPDRVVLKNFKSFERYIKSTQCRVLISFVCRSGSWTPPWADTEFFSFLDGSGATRVEYPEELIRREWEVSEEDEHGRN